MENPNLGVSDYDYVYGTRRCAYCNDVIILNNPETLERLYLDEVERLRLERNDPSFYLTVREERNLRECIMERERGLCIAYEQCLHYRCLAILEQADNEALLERIRRTNRCNINLPDNETHERYAINYANAQNCLHACAFCQRVLNQHLPGFAYCERSKKKTRHCQYLFLHDTCFNALDQTRCRDRALAAQARRNFIHLLTYDSASAWPNYSDAQVAQRSEAWLNFLSEYEASQDDLDALDEWIAFIKTQQVIPWSASNAERFLNNTEEYLLLLVTQLGDRTDEALETLEKELLDRVTEAESLPSICSVATPRPAIANQNMETVPSIVCGPTTVKQPALLYINLIHLLKQQRQALSSPSSILNIVPRTSLVARQQQDVEMPF